ncbi:MAG: hypothetical protein CVV34_01235 [Methanomicrobiales archaeon HGW-Methanomicrobiales-5]|nr:MAG: hypothetical protein CVV34_01235 [Methanomicrobiales archaeon HGW-Methanomicrobiales-5]
MPETSIAPAYMHQYPVIATDVTRQINCFFMFILPACSGTHLHFLMTAKGGSHPASPYSCQLIYSEYDRSDIMSRDRHNLNP